MKVLKFGGSSISSAKNIENVFNIIKNYESNIVVVFSAFGKTTDDLIKCGKLASKRDNNYKNILKSIPRFSTVISVNAQDISRIVLSSPITLALSSIQAPVSKPALSSVRS